MQPVDNPTFCLPAPLRIQNALLLTSWGPSTVAVLTGSIFSLPFIRPSPNELANNWKTLDSVIDSCPGQAIDCLLTFRGRLLFVCKLELKNVKWHACEVCQQIGLIDNHVKITWANVPGKVHCHESKWSPGRTVVANCVSSRGSETSCVAWVVAFANMN